MIQYVRNELINKNKWDSAVNNSINSYIYAYSFYLDIVADGQWDALIMDDYQMILPLPYRIKYGVKYLFQPPFTQQLGIFYRKTCSNFDVFEFFRAIPKSFRFAEMNFNKFMLGRIPPKYLSKVNQNFELEIAADYERLYQNYSTNLKRNLKKAKESNLREVNYVEPDEIIRLFQENKGAELKSFNMQDYQRLKKLLYMLMHKGKAELRGMINERNDIVAGAVFLQSNGRRIFLFSGLSAEGKEKGAMPLLIDSQINKFAGEQIIFDFEGSNDENLARFYAGFGALNFQYPSIRMNRLPFPLNYFKGLNHS
ncbi:MAG: hypothetical protein JXR34_11735 [Bacteroidales bacterium]|nr:hypothetical protein [Bacteroidales bacterium]